MMFMEIIFLNISQGLNLLVIGMLVVFSVLLLLYFSFSQLQRLADFFTKKENAPKTEVTAPKATAESANDEVNAAISFALYMYLNEQHDQESGVITIEKSKKPFSPWNSKIYGMNNTLTR